MVFFNYALRKLTTKVVYYGPGLCGKTTNLQWIHENFERGKSGKMVSLATEGDRTIFFDLLPIDIGKIRGMEVTVQLYTVPGQVHYNSTRQLVLKGADGVVFVADSQAAMIESNKAAWRNLKENLQLQGLEIEKFPCALQYNKRDLPGAATIEELDEAINELGVPFFEASAVTGVGVEDTLRGIIKLVMRSLKERFEGDVGTSRVKSSRPPAGLAPRGAAKPAILSPTAMPKPPRAPMPKPPMPKPPVKAPTPVPVSSARVSPPAPVAKVEPPVSMEVKPPSTQVVPPVGAPSIAGPSAEAEEQSPSSRPLMPGESPFGAPSPKPAEPEIEDSPVVVRPPVMDGSTVQLSTEMIKEIAASPPQRLQPSEALANVFDGGPSGSGLRDDLLIKPEELESDASLADPDWSDDIAAAAVEGFADDEAKEAVAAVVTSVPPADDPFRAGSPAPVPAPVAFVPEPVLEIAAVAPEPQAVVSPKPVPAAPEPAPIEFEPVATPAAVAPASTGEVFGQSLQVSALDDLEREFQASRVTGRTLMPVEKPVGSVAPAQSGTEPFTPTVEVLKDPIIEPFASPEPVAPPAPEEPVLELQVEPPFAAAAPMPSAPVESQAVLEIEPPVGLVEDVAEAGEVFGSEAEVASVPVAVVASETVIAAVTEATPIKLSIPVPAKLLRGKSLTLDIRLTLVPAEDDMDG